MSIVKVIIKIVFVGCVIGGIVLFGGVYGINEVGDEVFVFYVLGKIVFVLVGGICECIIECECVVCIEIEVSDYFMMKV